MVLFKTIILQFKDWMPLSLLLMYSAITARTTDVFAYEKYLPRKKLHAFKNEPFFNISFYFYYNLDHYRSIECAYWVTPLLFL